eukprot:Sspe_Gene.15868::Locus_5543_Transcript_1_1_Confidence_1.000_Length_14069::g.15868::m.15868/K10408/DNAH; dynein heavy chain, axonemal
MSIFAPDSVYSSDPRKQNLLMRVEDFLEEDVHGEMVTNMLRNPVYEKYIDQFLSSPEASPLITFYIQRRAEHPLDSPLSSDYGSFSGFMLSPPPRSPSTPFRSPSRRASRASIVHHRATLASFLISPTATAKEDPLMLSLVCSPGLNPDAGKSGKACFAFRVPVDHPVEDVPQQVCMGMIEGSVLQQLSNILRDVLAPMLAVGVGVVSKSASVAVAMAALPQPEAAPAALEAQAALKKLASSLNTLAVSESNEAAIRLQLPKHDFVTSVRLAGVENIRDPSNQHLVASADQIVTSWLGQTDTLLRQDTVPSHDLQTIKSDEGPLSELTFWKCQVVRIDAVLRQIAHPNAVLVLEVSSPDVSARWVETETALRRVQKVAKDNARFLSSLAPHIDPLYRTAIEKVASGIPTLLQNVALLPSLSSHYAVHKYFTGFLIKLATQLVNHFKNAVQTADHRTLWDQIFSEEGTLKLLRWCHMVFEVTDKYKRHHVEILGTEFNNIMIFGRLELFRKRVIKLVDVFGAARQFTVLGTHNILGAHVLVDRFRILLHQLRASGVDILDHTAPAFDKNFVAFSQGLHEIETSLQVFINTAFEKVTDVPRAIQLLCTFTGMLRSKRLCREVEGKYITIFNHFAAEVERVRKYFEKCRKNPPCSRNTLPASAAIGWARVLLRRLETMASSLVAAPEPYSQSREARKAIKLHNHVARALVEYESLWLSAWCGVVQPCLRSLSETVMVSRRPDKTFDVEFSESVGRVLQEAIQLMQMGVTFPKHTKDDLAQILAVRPLKAMLTEALETHRRVVNETPFHLREVLDPVMRRMEAVVVSNPSVVWVSLSAANYVRRVFEEAKAIDDLATWARDLADQRVGYAIQQMMQLELVDFTGVPFTLREFVEAQQRRIEAATKEMVRWHTSYCRGVEEIAALVNESTADSETSPSSKQRYIREVKNARPRSDRLKAFYRRLLFKSLLKLVTRWLGEIRRRLCGRRGAFMKVTAPFFTLQAHFKPPNIVIEPSLTEIQDAVNTCATDVLGSLSSLPPLWESPMGGSLYEEVARNREVVKMVLLLTGSIHGLKQRVTDHLGSFAKFQHLWTQNKNLVCREFASRKPPPSTHDYEMEIQKYRIVEREIDETPATHTVASLLIEASSAKDTLRQLAVGWRHEHCHHLHKRGKQRLDGVMASIDSLERRVRIGVVDSMQDLRVKMDALDELRDRFATIEFELTPIEDLYDLLSKNCDISTQEQQQVSDLRYRWRKLRQLGHHEQGFVARVQPFFRRDLSLNSQRFVVEATVFKNAFTAFTARLHDMATEDALEGLEKLRRTAVDKQQRMEQLRDASALFGLPHRRFVEVEETVQGLDALLTLYTMLHEVQQFISKSREALWGETDIVSLLHQTEKYRRTCRLLHPSSKRWTAYDTLKLSINDFHTQLSILKPFAQPCIHDRHWERLMELCGRKWSLVSDAFFLGDVLFPELVDYREAAEELVMSAVKEAYIEDSLQRIVQAWSSRNLSFITHPKIPGMLMVRPDEVHATIQALDESQSQLSSLLASRYIAAFRDEAHRWLVQLSTASETLAMWLEVQSTWLHLDAVFSEATIAKQLPSDAKRFAAVGQQWAKIMAKAQAADSLVSCTGDLTLLNTLVEQLGECQRKLSAYLEQKRELFPRLYFISEPVLLEILAQASDPSSLTLYLPCVFDGITGAAVHADHRGDGGLGIKIMALKSLEDETLQLSEPVLCNGNVEEWLERLRQHIHATVRDEIKAAAKELSSFFPAAAGSTRPSLSSFVKDRVGQVAIVCLHLFWTMDVAWTLTNPPRSEHRKAVAECTKRQKEALAALVENTRNIIPLQKRDRLVNEALVTLMVYLSEAWSSLQTVPLKARDTLNGTWEWLKLVRMSWRAEQETVVLRLGDAELPYGNEYYGVKPRLVLTPPTERCLMSMVQALAFHYSPVLIGQSAAGKTETVRDLARSCGKYLVSVNTDQLSIKGITALIKGLSQGGDWGCFDEVNHLHPSVLSTMALHLKGLHAVLKKRLPDMVLPDGSRCRLNSGVGVFATLTPAAARPIPSGLRSEFRMVGILSPDVCTISRIRLLSMGYQDCEGLARKLEALFRLGVTYLVAPKVFSLRTLTTILRAAGPALRNAVGAVNPRRSRRQAQEWFQTAGFMSSSGQEEDVIVTVIHHLTLPSLPHASRDMFLRLLQHIFDADLSGDRQTTMDSVIRKHTLALHLSPTREWITKAVNLYEAKVARHGVLVVGEPSSGKTRLIEVVLRLLTDLAGEGRHREYRIHPRVLTVQQMYGWVGASGTWVNGAFTTLWRRVKEIKNVTSWIVCDGPVDPAWCENLYSVLDDNKTLTLPNCDRLPMDPSTRLCIETCSLVEASAALVTRVGVVYMAKEELAWLAVVRGSLVAFGSRESDESGAVGLQESEVLQLTELFSRHGGQLWKAVAEEVERLIGGMTVHNAMCNVVRLLVSLLRGTTSREAATLERLFWVGMVWGIGGLCSEKGRQCVAQYVESNYGARETIPCNVFQSTVSDSAWVTCPDPTYHVPVSNMADMFVDTAHLRALRYFVDTAVDAGYPILVAGPQGAGKTVVLQKYLTDKEKRSASSMVWGSWRRRVLSCNTAPVDLQGWINEHTEKSLGSTYGPRGGGRLVLFVDDVAAGVGDTRPVDELIRQLVEFNGFWNTHHKGTEWKGLTGVHWLVATRTPSKVNPSSLQHFVTFLIDYPPDRQLPDLLVPPLLALVPPTLARTLAEMTCKVWSACRANLGTNKLRPHLVWSLRDLFQVILGLHFASGGEAALPSVWGHESLRTFGDRLNTVDDVGWLRETVRKTLVETSDRGEADFDKASQGHFHTFLHPSPLDASSGDVESTTVTYHHSSPDAVRDLLASCMKRMTEATAQRGADELVLFDQAVSHVVRLGRVLSLPGGNMLFVATGGSGRKAMVKLASYACGRHCDDVQYSSALTKADFDERLQRACISAGLGERRVFLYTQELHDTEGDKEILESLHMLLASGEVPSLFPPEDKESLHSDITIAAQRAGVPGIDESPSLQWRFFTDNIRQNLCLVVCLSPSPTGLFVKYLQQFPSLVTQCTVNWCFPWPPESLRTVARSVLESPLWEGLPVENTPLPDNKSILNALSAVHISVESLCKGFDEEPERRPIHFSSLTFKLFVEMFLSVYSSNHKHITTQCKLASTAVGRLNETHQDIARLKVKIEQREHGRLDVIDNQQTLRSDILRVGTAIQSMRVRINEDQQVVKRQTAEVAEAKQSAMVDLERAQPALKAAKEALEMITYNDVKALKSMANPPQSIRRIFDTVCLLQYLPMGETRVDHDMRSRLVLGDSWGVSGKHLVHKTDFLEIMMDLCNSTKKDLLLPEAIELIQPYLASEDFHTDRQRKNCGTVVGVSCWVVAMNDYYAAARSVRPKLELYRESEARLRVAVQQLQRSKDTLQSLEVELSDKQKLLLRTQTEQEAIEEEMFRLRKMCDVLTTLLDRLAPEGDEWTGIVSSTPTALQHLPGNSIVMASFVVYGGPFSTAHRDELLKMVVEALEQHRVPHNPALDLFSLEHGLSYGMWEPLYKQNYLILHKLLPYKFPLLIDPYSRALPWLRSVSTRPLKTISQADSGFAEILASHVQDGVPLVVKVEADIDPILIPLLKRSVVRTARNLQVSIGNTMCPFGEGFELYLVTAKPFDITPDLLTMVTVIDFSSDQTGLGEDLLSRLLQAERPDLEVELSGLEKTIPKLEIDAAVLGRDLLHTLSETTVTLSSNIQLAHRILDLKDSLTDVTESLSSAVELRSRLKLCKEEYRPVATRCTIVHSAIDDLASLNPMYRTNPAHIVKVFDRSVAEAPKHELTALRVSNIISTLTANLFRFAARGMQEKHRLLFAFHLACCVLRSSGDLDPTVYSFLFKAYFRPQLRTWQRVQQHPHTLLWLPAHIWHRVLAISEVSPALRALPEHMIEESDEWAEWYSSAAPEGHPLPTSAGVPLPLQPFDLTVLIFTLREDRFAASVTKFISATLGTQFVTPLPTDLEEVHSDATPSDPILVMQDHDDPTHIIEQAAKKVKIQTMHVAPYEHKHLVLQAVQQGLVTGRWVILQNADAVAEPFLQSIQDKLEKFRQERYTLHEDARLWLVARENPSIPRKLTECCIRIIPTTHTIKARMVTSLTELSGEVIAAFRRNDYKLLILATCFLHGYLQGSLKYRTGDWVSPLHPTFQDFASSIGFVRNHFASVGDDTNKRTQPISFDAMEYMLSQVFYGGSALQSADLALLRAQVSHILQPVRTLPSGSPTVNIIPGYKLLLKTDSPSPLHQIDSLPDTDTPSTFALREAVRYRHAEDESQDLLATIAGLSRSMYTSPPVLEVMTDVLADLPGDILTASTEKLKLERLGRDEPMTVVLHNENKGLRELVHHVTEAVEEGVRAIKGNLVLTPCQEEMLAALERLQVPSKWVALGWSSKGGLFAWTKELAARYQHLHHWLVANPLSYWLGGLLHPRSFVEAVVMEAALAKHHAIDQVVAKAEITRLDPSEVDRAPSEGVYIRGLVLQGAAWSESAQAITDQSRGDNVPLPLILLSAEPSKKETVEPVPTQGFFRSEIVKPKPKRPYHLQCYMGTRRADHERLFHITLSNVDAVEWELCPPMVIANPDVC